MNHGAELHWGLPDAFAKIAALVFVGLAIFVSIGFSSIKAADVTSILHDLPSQNADLVEQINLCIEDVEQTRDPSKRARYLRQLFLNKSVRQQKADDLLPLIANTIRSLPPEQLPGFAHVVAYYPSLQDLLVGEAQDPLIKDRIRLALVRNVPRHRVARELAEAIQSKAHRRYAFEALIRTAPSLREKLKHLNDLTSLPNLDSWAYSSYYELRPFAARIGGRHL